MARGRPGKNVEVRENDIRIRFTLNGRHCIPLSDQGQRLKPSAGNIKFAEKHAAKVLAAIASGTFSFAHFFPDSEQARIDAPDSFTHYSDLWLKNKSELAKPTLYQYGLAIETWKARELRPGVKLGEVPMSSVRPSELGALVGGVAWPSPRMRNNSLIPLRGIFALWVADDRKHRDDPMTDIGNAKFQKGAPDPFTPDEAEAIIERAYKKYPEQSAAYLEFAIYSFLRPEEQIALRWAKVDERTRRVRIDVVRTFKGHEKDCKTYEQRDLELEGNDRAWGALMRMKKHTFLKPHGHVFENPRTANPWHDERSQRDHLLKPILRALGIRERRAYCTRHTGITLALMAGCDPMWVARQSGHKNTKMIWEVYSAWIPGHDKGGESRKMGQRYGLGERLRSFDPKVHGGEV